MMTTRRSLEKRRWMPDRGSGRVVVRSFVLVVVILALTVPPALARVAVNRGQDAEQELAELSLEELMDVEVTSVSKAPERLFRAAAAVAVITSEDLRRAGVTRIPEALRMVPGVEVARVNANKWAVSIRGFNDLFANKLLVLVDGRSVYTPLFSGVFWDSLDLPIDDVERIEVIRGPGAPLWGANAVNGVVNIITKDSRDTQGTMLRLGIGTDEPFLGVLRHGGRLGEAAAYRVYGKLLDGTSHEDVAGRSTEDDWRLAEGGFRIDWHPGDDEFMASGQWHDNRARTTEVLPSLSPPFAERIVDDPKLRGGHLMGRWTRTGSSRSRTTLTASYTRTERGDAVLGNERNTFDLDFKHETVFGNRHEMVWGVEYRRTDDALQPTITVDTDDTEQTDHLVSGFVQDKISLADEALQLTLGTKFEHNDYTGFELQPGVRLQWTPTPRQALWGAISRAVRTPSRAEADLRVTVAGFADPATGLPVQVVVRGNESFGSEELVALELGYRARPADWATVDLAAFYNDYDELRTSLPLEPHLRMTPRPHVEQPFRLTNTGRGRSRGIEATLRVRPHERWRLRGSYNFLDLDVESESDIAELDAFTIEGASPRHRGQLLSELELTPALVFDTGLYYVDELPAFDVPGYTRLDVRLGWTPRPDLELSLVGSNLLNDRHLEFGSSFLGTVATGVPRSVSAYLVWRLP